jgi:hypothetical protein
MILMPIIIINQHPLLYNTGIISNNKYVYIQLPPILLSILINYRMRDSIGNSKDNKHNTNFSSSSSPPS